MVEYSAKEELATAKDAARHIWKLRLKELGKHDVLTKVAYTVYVDAYIAWYNFNERGKNGIS